MSLKKKYDNTIRDLKATFFDVFQEHTDELVGMIEMLAHEGTPDPVKIEAAIFQRIILLNKTASDVKHLMKNVELLDGIKGNGVAQVVSDGTKALVSEVIKVGANELSNANGMGNVQAPKMPPVQNHVPVNANASVASVTPMMPPMAQGQPASVPVQQNVMPPVAQNVAPVQAPVAPQAAFPAATPVPAGPVAPVQAPIVAQVQAPPAAVPVSNNAVADASQDMVAKDLMEMAIGDGIPEAKTLPVAYKKPTQFVKNGTEKVKAILVNDKQYTKLLSSRDKQFSLLQFVVNKDSNDATPSKEKIEKLMKKASALYKDGKVAEAQSLYSEISSLNKEINEAQGKGNVLIKKAA